MIHGYKEQLAKGLNAIPDETYYDALDVLNEVIKKDSFIYVGGNGGSSAISNHLICDYAKGPGTGHYRRLRAISLSSNTPLLTAISNDIGYGQSLSFQLDTYLDKEDVVILISSSGNSENIVEAIKVVRSVGATLIGLSGFSGGELKKKADISFHVPVDNYGVVEDCHQSIMHILSQMYFGGAVARPNTRRY